MNSPSADAAWAADPYPERFRTEVCVTCGHGVRRRRRPARPTGCIRGGSNALVYHFLDMPAADRLEQPAGFGLGILRIIRFDSDEEPIVRGEVEAGRFEQRVVQSGQPIEKEHPEQRAKRSEENCKLV